MTDSTTQSAPEDPRRLRTVVLAMAAAALLVAGVLALALGPPHGPIPGSTALPPTQPAAAGPAPGATGTARATPRYTPSGAATRATTPTAGDPGFSFLPASEPTSIDIPSIKVSSTTFVPLTVQANGALSVPGTTREVGLYRDGPTPGQLGPAVLAAHVDNPAGVPGIFYRLGAVKIGDLVNINRADGARLTFAVDRVQAFRKSAFPTELVYKGDFHRPELRLVTCGGPTDSHNEYRDNVVVFAHLTRIRR